nr:MAG TPA: hypothetical protein [Caudoviricetes sp.]
MRRKALNFIWDCLCIAGVFCSRASCDNWNFSSSNPCLYVGGNYSHNSNYGLFYVYYDSASNYNGSIGCRFLF